MEHRGPMKGKLKTLEEIKKDMKVSHLVYHSGIYVHHSKVKLGINIHKESFKNFGNTIEVKLWEDFGNRVVYYNGTSKDNYDQLYYDEWFLWIGEKMEHIPKELWSIEDL